MTEFYKVTGEKMSRYQKIRNVLLTVIVTLALQCTFEVCLGGYVDSNLVNGLNKLCGAGLYRSVNGCGSICNA